MEQRHPEDRQHGDGEHPTDHPGTDGVPAAGTGAAGSRQRHDAKNERQGGHEDRPQVHPTSLDRRLEQGLAKLLGALQAGLADDRSAELLAGHRRESSERLPEDIWIFCAATALRTSTGVSWKLVSRTGSSQMRMAYCEPKTRKSLTPWPGKPGPGHWKRCSWPSRSDPCCRRWRRSRRSTGSFSPTWSPGCPAAALPTVARCTVERLMRQMGRRGAWQAGQDLDRRQGRTLRRFSR